MKSIGIILSLNNPPKIFCGDFKDIILQKIDETKSDYNPILLKPYSVFKAECYCMCCLNLKFSKYLWLS